MEHGYSSEKNVQILIALLKKRGIRKVIASPGTTNIAFVASVQYDPFFEVYSAADERSAGYMACGLAIESGEPVVLSCTGATASRNYIPAMTEAYYRQIPVLAVTSMQHVGRIGQYIPQVLDRSNQINDTYVKSVRALIPSSDEDAWACNLAINDALNSLICNGGGPVHIDLQTSYSPDFSVKELPDSRVIMKFFPSDVLPDMPSGKIGIYVGAHRPFDVALIKAIEGFCNLNDAVVLCDQTSNYRGDHRVLAPIVTNQDASLPDIANFDLMIHIGQVSGSSMHVYGSHVWRVNPDGKTRDVFKKTSAVFEMTEEYFFNYYAAASSDSPSSNLQLAKWQAVDGDIRAKIPDLPFSNMWIAQQTAGRIPDGSVLHLGILNSLRSWNMFETPESVTCFSNTGGFGIDGCLSTAIGASLADKTRLYYCILGDLAFFYDMNSIGNRALQKNLRILVINNGRGTEFRNYSHPAARFGDDADAFMAAAGHYGNKSPDLVRHYATDLGFEYLTASSKEEYLGALEIFISPEIGERPVLFEVFTESSLESDALEQISSLAVDAKGVAKQFVKKALGQKGLDAAKRILGR